MSSRFTYGLAIEVVHCWECGITFAVPEQWLGEKIQGEESIYCPNGHRTSYANPKSEKDANLKEDNERLKRDLAQAIHDADQAQARRDEGKPPAEVELPPELPRPTGDIQQFLKSGRYRCPCCSKTYKSSGAFGSHVRVEHRIEPTTMQPVNDEGQAAA